jgi:DNA-binding MarR family transcriptional regulator
MDAEGKGMDRVNLTDEFSESSLTCTIRRVHRLLVKRVQARFPESDRSFEEWMALRLFADGQIETAGDLAREFGIATGATTRLIDSLEDQGFIERDRKNDDRRVVLLRLTPRGAAHFREKLPDLAGCWGEVLADWRKEEVDQLTALLAKLQQSFVRTGAR